MEMDLSKITNFPDEDYLLRLLARYYRRAESYSIDDQFRALSGLFSDRVADFLFDLGVIWEYTEIEIDSLTLTGTNTEGDKILLGRAQGKPSELRKLFEGDAAVREFFAWIQPSEEPILVRRHNGALLILDGMHRVIAAVRDGKTKISGYVATRSLSGTCNLLEHHVLYDVIKPGERGDKARIILTLKYLVEHYSNAGELLRTKFSAQKVRPEFRVMIDAVLGELNYESCIRFGEEARELGDYETARYFLDRAITLAEEAQDIIGVVEAYGHHCLIYKHRFQKTNNGLSLALMHADTEAMLCLCREYNLSGHPAAVAYLRAGDYHALKGEYMTAAQFGKIALDAVGKENFVQYIEFASHHALWMGLAGSIELAITQLFHLLDELRKVESIDKRQQLIMESGILLGLAKLSSVQKKPSTAEIFLTEARVVAQTLVDDFGFSQRMAQVDKLLEQIQGK